MWLRKLLVLALCALSQASITLTATAAVVERDWITPGDGLLTFDDVNNREWLDLSQTLRANFPPNFRIEDVAAELEPGRLFEGFTWANVEDVTAFAQSAGIDTESTDFEVNGGPAGRLLDLISPTIGPLPATNNSASVGLLDDMLLSPSGNSSQAIAFFSFLPSRPFAGLHFSHTAGDDGRPATSALMMYRNVPEPNSIALSALFIVGISKSHLFTGGAA